MTLTEQLGKIEKEALSIIEKYGKDADVSCLNLEHEDSGDYMQINKIVDYQKVEFYKKDKLILAEELDVYNIVLIADYLNKINNE